MPLPDGVTDDDMVALVVDVGPAALSEQDKAWFDSNQDKFTPEQLERFKAPGDPTPETPAAPQSPPTEEPKETPPGETPPAETPSTPETPANDDDLKETVVETDPQERKGLELPTTDEEDEDEEEKAKNNKRMQPVLEILQKQADDQEIRNFLSDPKNEVFKGQEANIRKYMAHPAYKGVPVDMIAKALDYENAMKRGARIEREAAREAAKKAGAGRNTRPQPSALPKTAPNGAQLAPDLSNATPEQLEEFANRVKNGEVFVLPTEQPAT